MTEPGISRLCIHTITTKPWGIEEAASRYASAGVRGITVWRNALEGRNIAQTGRMLRETGLSVVSLCRGGFFAGIEHRKRLKALEDNRRIIGEAFQLGAPLIILVCGADPGQPLTVSREQITEAISRLIPEAEAAGVRLAIEPLHPMYADTRSAINTLKQANDMAEAMNSRQVGVAVDVYHLWWDPDLEQEIHRCGKNGNLLAYHVSDWKTPTNDLLNDRGLMGEGCIPLKQIRLWMENAGFDGFIEVEIFSSDYWKMEQGRFLTEIVSAFKKYV